MTTDITSRFWSAPEDAFFTREEIAAIRRCSVAKLEREAWLNEGIPHVKDGAEHFIVKRAPLNSSMGGCAMSAEITISAQQFIDHILASNGYRCCTTIKSGDRKVVKNRFFASNGEASAFVTANTNTDVYIACATYKTADNRTQANVASIKAFWLDIDAGEGKPYSDFKAAAKAVIEFCYRTGFQIPTIVISGGGIHAWWVLTRAISPDQWQPAANLLKHLTQKHGLDADGSRTADHASILRIPGTSNWKTGSPRPCPL